MQYYLIPRQGVCNNSDCDGMMFVKDWVNIINNIFIKLTIIYISYYYLFSHTLQLQAGLVNSARSPGVNRINFYFNICFVFGLERWKWNFIPHYASLWCCCCSTIQPDTHRVTLIADQWNWLTVYWVSSSSSIWSFRENMALHHIIKIGWDFNM